MNDITPNLDQHDDPKEAAHEQVEYEKAVVDAAIMKSFYVAQALEKAGYCEEHRAGMMDVILAASARQQLFDVLQDMRTHLEMLVDEVAQLREERK